MIFSENEASILADLLMDYSDDAPGYDAAMDKLLAARDSEQDFTENDKLLILAAVNEYLSDTAKLLTPSYDSSPLSSLSTSGIFSERETIFLLKEQLLRDLHQAQSEL